MHPKANQYRTRRCAACDYKFSNEHHIHAELLGRSLSPTIILCPNHHLYAHILQMLISKDEPFETIQDFAEKNFDLDFNERVAPLLVDVYERLHSLRRLIELGVEKIALNELDKYGVFAEDPEEKLYYFVAKELDILSVYIPKMISHLEEQYRKYISAELAQMRSEGLFSWMS